MKGPHFEAEGKLFASFEKAYGYQPSSYSPWKMSWFETLKVCCLYSYLEVSWLRCCSALSSFDCDGNYSRADVAFVGYAALGFPARPSQRKATPHTYYLQHQSCFSFSHPSYLKCSSYGACACRCATCWCASERLASFQGSSLHYRDKNLMLLCL